MNVIQRAPLTIALSAIVLLIHLVPCSAESLQLDFESVSSGEFWRLWTGHLTHYHANHLFWDLLMFAGLGFVCESFDRRKYAVALGVMALAISSSVAVWSDHIHTYRGLSGIDTGLFTWLAATQVARSWRQEDWQTSALWLTPLAGLVLKLAYELATGQTLFVDSSDFIPLAESHFAGALVGFGLAIPFASGTKAKSALGFEPRVAD